MKRPEPWSRRGAGHVLLSPPASTGALAGGRRFVLDAQRVWELSAEHAWPWPIAGARRVVPDERGTRIEGPTWIHRIGAERADRSTWGEGIEAGGLRISVHEELVLVEGAGRRVVDLLHPREQLSVGPDGGLAILGRTLRVAPPSRTPVDVEVEVEPSSVRWSPSGRHLRVVT
ncbi:MAG: hypothetical protein KC621_03090, partial [Myxococcales bacterium]|nr:hypothetical protein [Myxococcales bacterium]